MSYLAVDTGKGSNTVASLLHDYFSNLRLGEMDQQLHADNCVVQNKNNTVMQVCMSQIIIITTVNYCYFLIVPSM